MFMTWKNKVLPLILRSAICIFIIRSMLIMLRNLFNFSSSQVSLLKSTENYLLLVAVLLGVMLVTLIEKPSKVLTVFVLICDVLILLALYTNFFTEDYFTVIFFCGFIPVFLLIIVLSYPKTAHYMMDKYQEEVGPTQPQK